VVNLILTLKLLMLRKDQQVEQRIKLKNLNILDD